MDVIRNRMKTLRENLELSYKDLEGRTGISRSTLQRYETASVENIPLNRLSAIAKGLSTTPGYLMGWEDLHPTDTIEWVNVPVFGSIACGEPIEAFNEIIDYATIPASWTTGGREYLVLTAKGNSMAPTIEDGDLAVIRKQPDCENGQICAVFVNDYNATLKKVYKGKDVITLQPLNRDMPPQVYTPDDEEVHILGVMVELRKRFE